MVEKKKDVSSFVLFFSLTTIDLFRIDSFDLPSSKVHIRRIQGPLLINIPHPPSDRIWFGFERMPFVDFQVDHRHSFWNFSSNHFETTINQILRFSFGRSRKKISSLRLRFQSMDRTTNRKGFSSSENARRSHELVLRSVWERFPAFFARFVVVEFSKSNIFLLERRAFSKNVQENDLFRWSIETDCQRCDCRQKSRERLETKCFESTHVKTIFHRSSKRWRRANAS